MTTGLTGSKTDIKSTDIIVETAGRLRNKNSGFPDGQPTENGSSFPLGSTLYTDGANFSIYCKNGQSVSLLFFDHEDDLDPVREILLDPNVNKTYHYWHIFISGVKSGQLYGYRVDGPHDPSKGFWFDPDKILLDPYAKALAVPAGFRREAFCRPGKTS